MLNNDIDYSEDIAIISIAGRFPGANNLDDFWENIKNGVESVRFFTDEELENTHIDKRIYSDSNYVKAGAVIEGIDKFDASFFGFNPREAQIFNPQHRIFLECAWEAIERAGYNPEKYEGRIGVYAGEGFNSYLMQIASNKKLSKTLNEIQALIGNDKDFLSTQVSYKLDLKGPSMTVQSGCSTSLLAIDLACQGLRNYQCDIALAGGVRLGIPQQAGYLYKEGSILSPDGHCRPFDEKANGTVGGNGAAIVGLKRLEEAIEDGDYIYAVIKGSAVNNDGAVKIGYTAPSIDGQSEAIYEALEIAGIDSNTIGYIETHGTGTVLGDPIEIDALKKVFQSKQYKKGVCALGSVKANIGHLDAAAGAAGVIKTALALKNKVIPPCVNFEKPNPKLQLEDSPFYVPTKALEWKAENTPRRASVSSFGIGGTNVHAILQEAPIIKSTDTNKRHHSILLSARSEKALKDMAANFEAYLWQHKEVNIADIAYTLQNGRKSFEYRKAIVCKNVNDCIEILEKTRNENRYTYLDNNENQNIVFMFSGQGSQYIQMGRDLYNTETVFKKYVDYCSDILKLHIGVDIRDILYPEKEEERTEQINQTYLAQPALFIIEYALAKTFIHYGIIPTALIGHSIGEYVAGCISGVFELEEVLDLVAGRGRLMQGQPHGVMSAVSAGAKEIEALLEDEIVIGAVNSPKTSVISGTEEAVKRVEERLEEKGISFVRLHTSHAFHSPMMNSIVEDFTNKASKMKLSTPKIPMLSNVTGTWLKDEEATDPHYWAKHLANSVMFSQGIEVLLEDDNTCFVEVGPGNTLCKFVSHHLKEKKDVQTISTMRHPKNNCPDDAMLYSAIGKLWSLGMDIKWEEVYKNEKRLRIPLPTYPFERKRYWIDPVNNEGKVTSTEEVKHTEISKWLYTPYWKPVMPLSAQNNTCRWLVFADTCGVGDGIVSKLQHKGNDVIVVTYGTHFEALEDGNYSLNPNNFSDYNELFKHLKMEEKLPQKIIHLWSVTQEKDMSEDFFNAMQTKGFYSIDAIVKALGNLKITEPIFISIVTNNMQQTLGQEIVYPEKATVLAMCRVIPQEYVNVSCKSIDIEVPVMNEERELAFIGESIIRESYEVGSEHTVAYRGRTRFIEEVENIKPYSEQSNSYLREEGVYLITGGLGNIGLTFAKELAKSYRAKLVLVGRSSFIDREEWDAWLEVKGENDPISKKILAIKEIEAFGAHVFVCRADVSNEEEMKKAIADSINRFAKIDGIIHGAGVVGMHTYRSIHTMDKEQVEEQFKPKIHGLRVLEKVLKDVDIEFCLLVSSLSTVLGGLGLASYAAANLYMDRVAKRNNKVERTAWISSAWDGWAFSESIKSPDDLYITPEEGGQVLHNVLIPGMMDNIILSVGDLRSRIDKWIIGSNQLMNTSFDPEHEVTLIEIGNETEQKIAAIWSDVLGIEEMSIYDNFFELGGDSLLATQVIYRIRGEMSKDIPIQDFFEAATIHQLAAQVKSHEDNEKQLIETFDMVASLSEEDLQRLLKEA